ncbi:right-handed parallel beta-helix repeat-containing protein [Luteolibacter soli]|uniref:Right-handed parallel beta-helix repeat-containing protein n=1 Tax=Luteolibacter soli TaxID=3135280 RepID=A0ABU9ATB4_9BACT
MDTPHISGPVPAGRSRSLRLRGTSAQRPSVMIAMTLAATTGLAPATDYFVTTQYGFETWLDSLNLEPGDRILLRGGTTFTGTLNLEWWDSGDDAAGNLVAPIVISSYGPGRATIAAGDGPAISAKNNGGIEISNLNLVGSGVAPDGTTTNTASGISFYNDSPGDLKFGHIRISDVEVSGFGERGIAIGGYNGHAGYDDVEISGVVAHDNLQDGIETYGANGSNHALTNVRIRHCVAYHQYGDPDSNTNSGNGIVLGGVTGGLIEHCVAYENGANCETSNGPVGIWTYDSSSIVIQCNESHHNLTAGGDGGGFDFDLKVSDSVMQYNYSHDNAGAGLLIYGTSGQNGNDRNIVRYNISEDDGRDPGSPAASGINVSNNVDDLAIYGNTVIMSAPPGSTSIPAIKVVATASQPDDIIVANNIFVTSGGTRLVNVDSNGDVTFAGNNYWSSGDNFVIRDDGSNFGSLSSWRNSKGQERLNNQSTGFSVDPLFQVPQGVTVKSLVPSPLAGLKAFKLQAGSPLINHGLDLKAKFNLDPGPRDFFAAPIVQGSALEIGAHEFASTAPVILGCAYHAGASPSFTIRYQSEIGESFGVRRSPGLAGEPALDWTALSPTESGNGEVMEYVDTPPSADAHFYVLKRE